MPFDESAEANIKEHMARGDYDSVWYRYQRIWQKSGYSGPEDVKFRQFLHDSFGFAYSTKETSTTNTVYLESKLFPSVAFIVEPDTAPAVAVNLTQIAAMFKDFGVRAVVCPSSEKRLKEYSYYIVYGDTNVQSNDRLRPIAERARWFNGAPDQKPTRKQAIRFLFDICGLTPPKVTIAIPTKNRAWCLPTAIQSVLDNDYPNIEISIADCNSTDNTLEVMEQFEDMPEVTFHSGPYKTGAEALNAAVRRSTGDYVGYLADDDFYDKNQILRTAFYLASHPDTYAVFADGRSYNSTTHITTYEAYRNPFLDFNTLLEKNYINGQTVMHKNNKEVLMDENFPIKYGEDYLQWLYIAAKYGWVHLPFLSGTYVTGHPDRLGAVFANRLSEANIAIQRHAMRSYAPMRRRNKNDVHVAIFSGIYGKRKVGGPGALHWNVVDALTKAGVDVAVVTDDPAAIDMPAPERPHCIISTNDFFKYHVKNYNVFHNFAGNCIEQLRKLGIRPICGSTIVTNCGFPCRRTLFNVYKTAGDWEAARAGDQGILESMNAALWIYQSEYQARSYRELCRYDGKMMQLRNPIDTQTRYKFTPMDARPKTVLWTGHAGRGKGFPEFLVLAKAMKDVRFQVYSASHIPNAPSLPNVTYVFGKGTNEMPAALRGGCVLLTTSLDENQPMAVLEAMSTGLPVVGFASNSGMDEVVHDGENGRLVPFLDVPAMEDALRSLLEDDTLRAEMGLRARDYMVQIFSYETVVNQYLDICGEYLDDVAKVKLKQQGVKL